MKVFVNRIDDREYFRNIITSIDKEKNLIFLLNGNKGIGKTSLVKKISEEMEKNLVSITFDGYSHEELLRRIAKDIDDITTKDNTGLKIKSFSDYMKAKEISIKKISIPSLKPSLNTVLESFINFFINRKIITKKYFTVYSCGVDDLYGYVRYSLEKQQFLCHINIDMKDSVEDISSYTLIKDLLIQLKKQVFFIENINEDNFRKLCAINTSSVIYERKLTEFSPIELATIINDYIGNIKIISDTQIKDVIKQYEQFDYNLSYLKKEFASEKYTIKDIDTFDNVIKLILIIIHISPNGIPKDVLNNLFSNAKSRGFYSKIEELDIVINLLYEHDLITCNNYKYIFIKDTYTFYTISTLTWYKKYSLIAYSLLSEYYNNLDCSSCSSQAKWYH